jgi:hypothetical protein
MLVGVMEEILAVIGQEVLAQDAVGQEDLADGEGAADASGFFGGLQEGGAALDVEGVEVQGDLVELRTDFQAAGEALLGDAVADPLAQLGEDGGPFEVDLLGEGGVGDHDRHEGQERGRVRLVVDVEGDRRCPDSDRFQVA